MASSPYDASIERWRDHWRADEQERLDRQRQEIVKLRDIMEKMQAAKSAGPRYQNGTNATLETDGIVIESGDTRIVVRGDLLEKLATLVTMARMAKLIGADEP